MSELPGNWFTIGGRASFWPRHVTLQQLQDDFPGVLVTEGITPAAQSLIDFAEQQDRADRAQAREFLKRWPGRCRKCGGAMTPGKAILPAVHYSKEGTVSTVTYTGAVAPSGCSKCEDCGWSVTAPR